MTKKEALTTAINALFNDDTHDYDETIKILNNMITALDKRAETPRKPSPKDIAKQEQNAIFRANVYKAMGEEPNRLWQVKELAEKFEVSTPKMSAALTALKKIGYVKRDTGATAKVITFQYVDHPEATA